MPVVPDVVTGWVTVCIVAEPVACPPALVAVDALELEPQPTSPATAPTATTAPTHMRAFTTSPPLLGGTLARAAAAIRRAEPTERPSVRLPCCGKIASGRRVTASHHPAKECCDVT